MASSILSSAPVQAALGALVGGYMRLCLRTARWRIVDPGPIEAIWAEKAGVIVCFWHSRVMLGPQLWRGAAQPGAALISRSAEGEIIARAASLNGIASIRGSSRNRKKKAEDDKGALTAYREMVRHLRAGGGMGITPDGPRGPRQRASMGPVQLASATGAPVIAVGLSLTPRRLFNSWDRFLLPLPFGRGVIVWGEPFTVPKKADPDTLEHWRIHLEDAVNAATAQADTALGREPVEPAPGPAPGRRAKDTS
ncbi:DUF374 domain-containing protein [Glycocaulis profundi]|nr:DUF374 domain-containing protein [Glycocaulis profundi]